MFDRHGGIGAPSSRPERIRRRRRGHGVLADNAGCQGRRVHGLQWAPGAAPTLAAPLGRIRPMEGREGPFWDVMEGRRDPPPAAGPLGWRLVGIYPDAGIIAIAF